MLSEAAVQMERRRFASGWVHRHARTLSPARTGSGAHEGLANRCSALSGEAQRRIA